MERVADYPRPPRLELAGQRLRIVFAALRGHVAVHAGPMDACWVGDTPVEPQPGGLYGGCITPDLLGLFKGGPGTLGW